MQKEISKAKRGEVTYTWDTSEDIPRLNLWNFKGEKITSFYISKIPKKASDAFLTKNKSELKMKAQEFYKKHQVRAVNVLKVAKGIVFRAVISAFPEWYKLCRTTNWVPTGDRFKYLEAEELMQQCRKDGIANIIPIVAYFGKSPQELKKVLGEKEWKKLCKNSYSRNRLLFMKADGRITPVEWNAVPSTLLKGRKRFKPEVLSWLVRTQDKTLKEIATGKDIQREAHLYLDTHRMCAGAGETFNPCWSKRRMKEEHDRLSRMQQTIANQKRALRDTEYAKLLSVDFRELHKGLESITFDSGIVATPLVNMQQVQDEGTNMHHCVGSYAEYCARGEYLVWHLRKGAEESTLGIRVIKHQDSTKQYVIQQHYGKCNSEVSDRDFVEAANTIIKVLNASNNQENAHK